MLRSFSALAVAVTLLTPAFADDEKPYGGPAGGLTAMEHCAQTTGGNDVLLDECFADDLRRLDAKLNATYTYLMRMGDNDFKNSLRNAQRAWIAYRDSTCETESGTYMRNFGTEERSSRMACLHNLTDDRVDWLKKVEDKEGK